MFKPLAKLIVQMLLPVLVDEIKQLLTKHKDDAKESDTTARESGEVDRDIDSPASSSKSSLGNV